MKNIIVKNLGKKYKRYPNQWSRFAEWVSGERFRRHEEKWVIKGVNFKIQEGEAVGIVGQNGAGKSTLLKILTGTTKPSEGSIQIKGRVGALLELGMGFHPDFTGRANATMACQMAGLNNSDIQSVMPEIEKFSELGDYLDQPLRVYSSGMGMRLAFSAVTVIRPDILIVDEALSVGDAYFAHKCMHRIREFQQKGTTLLFVSHDPVAVKSLCTRALLIDKGILIRDGNPSGVLDYYNAMIAKKSKDEEIRQVEDDMGRSLTRSGNGRAIILKIEIVDINGRPSRAFRVGETAEFRCLVECNAQLRAPTVGILIRDRLGNDVFGTNTFHMESEKQNCQPGDTLEVSFSLPLNLGYGNYSLTAAVHSRDNHLGNNYDWWDQCLVFQVIPNDSFVFTGLVSLPVEVEMKRRNANS